MSRAPVSNGGTCGRDDTGGRRFEAVWGELVVGGALGFTRFLLAALVTDHFP